jgi:hypothetical protein
MAFNPAQKGHLVTANPGVMVSHRLEGALNDQNERSTGYKGLGIEYELREYEVDPDDLSADSVAAKITLPAEHNQRDTRADAAETPSAEGSK